MISLSDRRSMTTAGTLDVEKRDTFLEKVASVSNERGTPHVHTYVLFSVGA